MNSPPCRRAEHDYPLAGLTYYHIGGPARLALFPVDAQELIACHAWLRGQDIPRLIMGGGANMLISDDGFSGVVLCTVDCADLTPLGDHRFEVSCGVPLASLVTGVMLADNYAGVGALTGIPGTVGGAIFMNAGTVNGSVCALLESVDVTGHGGTRRVKITPDLYAYRGQCFCAPDELIISAIFRFTLSDQDERGIYDHYMTRRRETQPQGFCCGSVFKNPPGQHAGRLIEACGLKGARIGGAHISTRHANFIINDQCASFADVMGLIALCKEKVLEKTGAVLEEEVRIIASRPSPRV